MFINPNPLLEYMLDGLSKIEKILITTCFASSIALMIGARNNEFNVYDIVPYVTALASSGALLVIHPYKVFCLRDLDSSYQRKASETD